MPSAYQQNGKVHIHGDSVHQEIKGPTKTAEYSLHQLAAHAEDPKLFRDTMEYAAKHGDPVKIDFHNGVTSVRDTRLEHELPEHFPHRDAILQAAMRHEIDPKLLAAVGEQETNMGKGALYDQKTHIGADGHGHGIWQMDDRFNSKADCEKAGKDPNFAADAAAAKLSNDMHAYGKEMGIQAYNTAADTSLPYYHSVMGHYAEIEAQMPRQTKEGPGR